MAYETIITIMQTKDAAVKQINALKCPGHFNNIDDRHRKKADEGMVLNDNT